MDKIKLVTYKKKYASLLSFLAIELLLFTSLNLANYGMLFRYLSILLAVGLIPITLMSYKKEDWLNVGLLFGLPLFAYGAFMAFSPLYYLLQNVVDNIVMILSIMAFLLIGLTLAQTEDFQIEKGLAAIFAGLTILLAISLVYTLWRYTFFYVIRYAGQTLYFDGEAYAISNEAKFLFGFDFKEVTTSYFASYATILAPLSLGLFFIPLKQIKKFDFIWIGAGAIGLLSIAFLPYVSAIKYLVPALVLTLFLRFYPKGAKWRAAATYAIYAFIAIFIVAAILLLLYAFEVPFMSDLVASNPIFRRVFGNSIVTGYAKVIAASFAHPFGGLHPIIVGNSFIESTRSAFFDTLYQGGFFPVLGLLALVGFGGYSLVIYYNKSTDAKHHKMLIIVFLLTFIVNAFFNYDYAPFVREGQRIYKTPFFSDLTSLMALFLIGYAYQSGLAGAKKKSEAFIAASPNVE
ncbi:MAG TPA: hypothetical protein PK340_04470 [Bacilli bacterium]|nr:hypothetical protein [Bacilli bacterium]